MWLTAAGGSHFSTKKKNIPSSRAKHTKSKSRFCPSHMDVGCRHVVFWCFLHGWTAECLMTWIVMMCPESRGILDMSSRLRTQLPWQPGDPRPAPQQLLSQPLPPGILEWPQWPSGMSRRKSCSFVPFSGEHQPLQCRYHSIDDHRWIQSKHGLSGPCVVFLSSYLFHPFHTPIAKVSASVFFFKRLSFLAWALKGLKVKQW